ncbi:MAG: hypothetical protein K2X82_06635 [Gemmataceae bacterium]|nr:hypothetical protein [Gemmataceae bacterium]
MVQMLWRAAAAAAVAAGLVTAQPASAALIVGELNFVPIGTVTVVGGGSGLGNISSITFPGPPLGQVVNGPSGAGGGTGDYAIIPALTPVGVAPLTIPIFPNVGIGPFPGTVPVITFGPPGDLTRFVFTPHTIQMSSTGPDVNGASSLSYATTGTVVDTLGFYDDTPTAFSFSATQSTLTGPINVSFTLVSSAAPAPAGLVLVLTAVPALGLARRFRRRGIA